MSFIRSTKQIVFIIIMVGLFAILAVFLYSSINGTGSDPSATPSPSILNIEASQPTIIKVGELDYDVIATLKNPNKDFGASSIIYRVILLDEQQNVLYDKLKSAYILPSETKYIVESPVKTTKEPVSSSIKIENVTWEYLKNYINANSLFSVRYKNLSKPDSVGFGTKLSGEISNNSDFSFNSVEVSAILFDHSGNIVAVNQTDLQTFLTNTSRYFELFFVDKYDPNNTSIKVDVSTNVYENLNFIKTYGDPQKFQQLLKQNSNNSISLSN